MHFSIPWAYRHGHGTKSLAPQLKSNTGSPESIANCDLHTIILGKICHLIAAGKHVGPVVYVLLGIAKHLTFSSGARGGVNADNLVKGCGPQGKGIALP